MSYIIHAASRSCMHGVCASVWVGLDVNDDGYMSSLTRWVLHVPIEAYNMNCIAHKPARDETMRVFIRVQGTREHRCDANKH